ncbi:MAG TPA: hypothetical protein VMB50_17190 [Myxococcales bacterium]|nr:hypothetical protein [Myxococcales bacterium]
MSWRWRTALLASASLGFATCNPSTVFIDPTGKSCTPITEPCPEGWDCVPAADDGGTICWPAADAGELDGGLPDAGTPDGGRDGGSDAGLDGGRDGGLDGGGHDGGLDGGQPDGGRDGGAVDGGRDGGATDGGKDGGGFDSGQGCTISGELVPSGATNPGNPCQVCDPNQSQTAWTMLGDGAGCGGTELCYGGVCSDGCEINGTFETSTQVDPANACEECEPAQSNSSWTTLDDGTSCDAGLICSNGSCAAACDIGGTIVAAGDVNLTNACEQCIPSQSTSGWTTAGDGTPCNAGMICVGGSCAPQCDIGGTIFSSGNVNPGNGCQECLPGQSTSGWSNEPDGLACSTGEVCAGGTCTPDCYIGGNLVAPGTPSPANPCLSCQPATSTTSYSDVTDGMPCGTGLSCAGGACCGGAHGTLLCGGSPVDTCLDDLNCGSCGAACTPPNGCFAGACQLPALLPTARDSMAVATGPDGRIYAMGGFLFSTNVTVATVEIFDPRTNQWATGASLPTPVEFAGAVADATGVFVMGGYDCATPSQCNNGTGTTEAFAQFLDTSTGIWSKSSNAPITFSDTFPAIGPSGVFFMPGGLGTASSTETLRFTPTGNGAGGSWTNSGPLLPIGTWDMGVTAGLDGTIYSINGTNTNTSPNSEVFTLKPGASSWNAIANDPTPRCDLAAATDANGLVYAIGGDNCDFGSGNGYVQYGNVEIFDPGAGSWSTGPALPNMIAYITAAVGPEGRIYVIGGLDYQDENYVQVYDPVNGYWIP